MDEHIIATIDVAIDGGLQVPVFSLDFVERLSCARYARLAAAYMFDLHYNTEAGWNMRYVNRVAAQAASIDELAKLACEGTLMPGMLIGIKYKESSYRERRDLTGALCRYTHMALYLGREQEGHMIDQQVGARTQVISWGMPPASMIPQEVLAPPHRI
jgi:hypothetical protein